jgi:outer membrane protein OmpA-like peptidoglycan-associated protein
VVAPPPPPVVVADAPPPPPPPPALTTVCDAVIELDGHVKFPHEVEFETGKSKLKSTDTTNKILQCLVDLLNNNKMVTKFRLEGYTDNQGDEKMNLTLSEARAQAVVDWMTGHGTEGGKLWAKGYGPKRPVAANDSPEHMAMNRRVEFHIDELDGVHVSPDRVKAALNPVAPAAVVVAAPPPPGGVTVTVPAVAVGVGVPTVGVAVGVPTVGVAVGVPTVAVAVPTVAVAVPTVGVTTPTSVSVGFGGSAPGAAGKKDDKKAPPKDDKKKK